MIALSLDDARYPSRLRDLARPPRTIWVEGELSCFEPPAVAIVGTRRMTGYGERVARELAVACAAAGVVVVSGLAHGIDSAAHRGALDGGGSTVAVLGESLASAGANIRGRRRALVPRIREHGALVSEFAAPFAPRGWMFAQRDATIAALAEVVVIVEAPVRSGALITAGHACDLGRRLYAVPGPIGSSASEGTNALIAQGVAAALVSADQLVRATGQAAAAPASVAVDPLLDALRDGALGLDEIARRTRSTPQVIAARITELLMADAIRTQPDGRIARR